MPRGERSFGRVDRERELRVYDGPRFRETGSARREAGHGGHRLPPFATLTGAVTTTTSGAG